MQNNQSRLVNNSIWNSIGMLTYFACQWLMTIIVVWLYEDYTNVANLSLAMNITNVFAMVALYNVRAFQVSDIKEEYKDREYIRMRLLTCGAAIVLCAAFVFIMDLTLMQRMIIICYMLFRANEAFIDVLHGIDQKNWKMKYIGISFTARGILKLLAFIVLGWLFGLLPAIIGMFVITTIVGLLYDIPKTKKLIQTQAFSFSNVTSLLKRCFPLMLVTLSGVAIVSLARFSIYLIHGEDAMAIFAAVTTPVVIVQLSITVLFTPMMKVLANYLKDNNKAGFIRMFTILALIVVGITGVAAVGALILGEWGLGILYGGDSKFINYAYLLPGAAIAVGLTAFMWFLNLIFSTTRDIKGLFFGNVFGLVICILTTNMFLNTHGIMGTNYVMIVAQGAVVISLTVRLFWCLKNDRELFS